ncbi:UNVERIFIED_CONTAM: hypothetical protein HDU68_004406 [Siphonaria sp. JEL0065]|nr:hypothetical protein HDU68_004406 [Siphonaria sp. JEL0065]
MQPILSPLVSFQAPEGYPLHEISADQLILFHKVKDYVAALFAEKTLTGTPLPGEVEWANDECILRYLRAAKLDADKACAMILKTLRWRRDYRPTEISANEVESESENGKAFFQGFDLKGRPVFVLNSAITLSKDPERYLRFILFNLERGTALCPHGVSQVSAIADVNGVGMFNQNPISVTTRLAEIFQNHYPERLGWICILNPTWYLWVLSKLVLPFIDPVTKAKIHFSAVSSTPKKASSSSKLVGAEESEAAAEGTGGWINDLSQLMDLGQLPVSLGGNYEYTYQHSVYWKAFTQAVGL